MSSDLDSNDDNEEEDKSSSSSSSSNDNGHDDDDDDDESYNEIYEGTYKLGDNDIIKKDSLGDKFEDSENELDDDSDQDDSDDGFGDLIAEMRRRMLHGQSLEYKEEDEDEDQSSNRGKSSKNKQKSKKTLTSRNEDEAGNGNENSIDSDDDSGNDEDEMVTERQRVLKMNPIQKVKGTLNTKKCRICYQVVLQSPQDVENHLRSKKHKRKMKERLELVSNREEKLREEISKLKQGIKSKLKIITKACEEESSGKSSPSKEFFDQTKKCQDHFNSLKDTSSNSQSISETLNKLRTLHMEVKQLKKKMNYADRKKRKRAKLSQLSEEEIEHRKKKRLEKKERRLARKASKIPESS